MTKIYLIRHAKRQGTWFRRERDAIRIMRGDYNGDTGAIMDRMLDIIRERTGITAKEVGNPYES